MNDSYEKLVVRAVPVRKRVQREFQSNSHSGRRVPSFLRCGYHPCGRCLAQKRCPYGVTMKTLTSRLLFVDDDREFLQNSRQLLPQAVSVETVSSIDEALEKLQVRDFGVIGIDLNAS